MAVALAQSAVAGTALSGATGAATFGGNTTTGNTIVVITAGWSGTSGAISVTGVAISAGTATFAKVIAQAGNSSYPDIEAWVAPNIVGGTTPKVTVTYGTTLANVDVYIYELSGMPATTTTDGTAAGAAQSAATACSSPAITTAGTNDIIFTAFSPTGNMTAGEGGSWQTLIGSASGTAASLSQYIIETSTQTGLTGTATQSSSSTYGAIVFALQGTSSSVRPNALPVSTSSLVPTVRVLYRPVPTPVAKSNLNVPQIGTWDSEITKWDDPLYNWDNAGIPGRILFRPSPIIDSTSLLSTQYGIIGGLTRFPISPISNSTLGITPRYLYRSDPSSSSSSGLLAQYNNYRSYPVSVSSSLASAVARYLYRSNAIASSSSSSSASFAGSTPGMVQHVATGMDGLPAATFTINLPNLTLSGNLLVCCVQYQSSGSITSVKDSQGNSFTLGTSFSNATYNKKAAIYYLANCVSGSTGVNIVFSGSPSYPHGDVSEWYNIATSSPVDGTPSNSSTSKTAGSITTANSGDLVMEWGLDLSDNGSGGQANLTSITAGSGYTLVSADLQVGSCVQYQVQSSAGAINPTFTSSGAATWGSLAIAFKAAASGTAPSTNAMRIVNLYQVSLCGGVGSTFATQEINSLQFPSQGNLLVASWQSGGRFITGASDSNSNTWVALTAGSSVAWGSGPTAQIAYAANAVTGPNLSNISFTFSGSAGFDIVFLYDIVNASTAPYDSVAGNQLTNGQQTSNGNLTTVSITPSTIDGIVISNTVVDFGTMKGCATPGTYSFDAAFNSLDDNNPAGTNGTNPSSLAQDGGYAHVYNSSTSSLTFVYTENSISTGGTAGAQFWIAVAAAFKASPYRTKIPGVSTSSTTVNPEYLYRSDPGNVSSSLLHANEHALYRSSPTSLSTGALTANYESGKYRSLPTPTSLSVLTLNPEYLYRPDPHSSSSSVTITNIETSGNLYILSISPESISSMVLNPRYLYNPQPPINTDSLVELTFRSLYLPAPPLLSSSSASATIKPLYRPDAIMVSTSSAPYIAEVFITPVSGSSAAIKAEYLYRSNPSLSSLSSLLTHSELRYRPGATMNSGTILLASFVVGNIAEQTAHSVSSSAVSLIARYLHRIPVSALSSGLSAITNRFQFRPIPSPQSTSSMIDIPLYLFRPDPISAESSSLSLSSTSSSYRAIPGSVSHSIVNLIARYLYRSNPASSDLSSASAVERYFYRPDALISTMSSMVANTGGTAYRPIPSLASGSMITIIARYLFRPDAISKSSSISSVNARDLFRPGVVTISLSGLQAVDRVLYRAIESIVSGSHAAVTGEYLFRPDPSIISSCISGIFPNNFRSYPTAQSLSAIGINVEFINAAVLTGGNKGPERLLILSGGSPLSSASPIIIIID